ncbi:MAG: hypothetical protein ACFB9M_08035 [Myxococcota bacterium]
MSTVLFSRPRWLLLSAVASFGTPSPSHAEPTRELRLQGPEEIFEGDPVSAGLTATGYVVPGTELEPVLEAVPTGVTRLVRGGDGHLYVGTTEGLFWMDEKLEPVPEIEGAVTALTATKNGVLAGASPSGMVVRVEKGSPEQLADLAVEYVWDLTDSEDGVLAATGAPGRVIRIEDDRVEPIYSSQEVHIRALCETGEDIVFVGGELGIVYRWSNGSVRALYDSPLEEGTSVAVSPSGEVLASFVSAKRKAGLPPFAFIPEISNEKDEDKAPFKGSELVAISPSGAVRVLWRSQQEGALSVALHEEEALIATGTAPSKKARLYAVNSDGEVRLLARVDAPLISDVFIDGARALLGTAPMGRVLRRTTKPPKTSIYRSSEQDFQRVGRVGRIWFDADVPRGSSVSLRLRTGNTEEVDDTWTPWSDPCRKTEGCPVRVARGRYAQFEASLSGDKSPPVVRSLHASVTRLNEAPRLVEVFELDRGIVMERLPVDEDRDKTITLSRSSLDELRPRRQENEGRQRVRQSREPGFQSMAWHATDTNGDDLLFKVEIRPASGDDPWVLLAEELDVPYLSFDGRAFEDGRYVIRVEASDRPSNAPQESLTSTAISEPFLVDNGAPEFVSLKASRRSHDEILIEAKARDSFSPLAHAQVSVDGGPWVMLAAKDGMVDFREETFRETLTGEPLPKVVAVRVIDAAENEATASVRVR